MSKQGTLAGFLKPAPLGPLSEEEQRRADAARKLKELEEAREGAVARGNAWLRRRFGLDQPAPVGRPPAGYKERSLRRKLQHRELVAAYRADIVLYSKPSYIISLEEWFDTWACRKLCGEKGWGELHHLDDGGVEEGAVEDADDDAPAPPPAPPPPKPPKTYDKANPLLMKIYTCWMHKWAADGSHAGWSTAKVLIGKAEQLELKLKRSTAARYLAAERVLYDSGKGMRKKVSVAELIRQLGLRKPEQRGEVVKELIVDQEPAQQTVFGAHLIPALKDACTELVDTMGFGPDVVAGLAADLYHADLAEDEPEVDIWCPSAVWCYWFMHKHLGLVPRRITSKSTATPEQVEKQKRLHEINIDIIAIARAEGLRDEFIYGSDEFGMHLFPQNNVKWEKKGAKQVASDMGEDKRSYTGDCVHTCAGEVNHGLQIWGGKTDASLPPEAVRLKFNGRIRFDRSANHWANHDTKMRLIMYVWETTVRRWSEMQLEGDPRCILLLDCWPVNLTQRLRDEVREQCPGMRILFIPAGATGLFQINDTHLHKPLKAIARKAALSWRMDKILVLRRRRDEAVAGGVDKVVAQEEMCKSINALMGMKVLRRFSPHWLWAGIERLLEPADGQGTPNLIRKGWLQLYLNPAAGPGFVAQAYARRTARVDAAIAAELARRMAAAAAGDAAVAAAPAAAAVDDAAVLALAEQVGDYEKALHEAEVPKVQPRKLKPGAKQRQGRGGAVRRAARRGAAGADVAPEHAAEGGEGGGEQPEATGKAAPPVAGGGSGGGGGIAPLDTDSLKQLSVKGLKDLCAARDVAQSGSKETLIERLLAWRPGDKRSKRGRKPGWVAAGGAAKKAKTAVPVDDAEMEAEELEEVEAEVLELDAEDADVGALDA